MAALNPSYSRYVGMEGDLVLTYNFTSHAQAQPVILHFVAGDYARRSLSAPGFGAVDANYVYLQMTFKF